MLSQMLFSCTYGEKCVTRSWNILYLNFQATCNVLAQRVKFRKMSLTSCRALSTPGKFSNVDRYGNRPSEYAAIYSLVKSTAFSSISSWKAVATSTIMAHAVRPPKMIIKG